MSAYTEAAINVPENAPNLADPQKLFKVGRHLLARGQYREALVALEQAAELNPQDVSYRSFYGLCLVESGQNREKGLQLCRDAVKQAFCHVETYVNLAKAHLALGNQGQAVAVLQKGTVVDPADRSLLSLQHKVGRRRRPVFPFLRRSNPLNQIAGRIRHTVLRSTEGSDGETRGA